MKTSPLFGTLQIQPGEFLVKEYENFSLGIKREKEGWILLSFEGGWPFKNETPDFSEGEYYQTGKANTLLLAPSLPAKPLVFMDSKLNVSPKQKLTFSLKIPLTIQAYFAKKSSDNLLKEFETQRLSNTWFGDPDSGEPAFTLGSDFFFNPDDARLQPHEALCPVSILNSSSTVLKVERMILRVENMALYKNNDKIITSLAALDYKGKDIISIAEYRVSKKIHGEKAEIIAKPKSSVSKNILKINFHFIKNIYKSE